MITIQPKKENKEVLRIDGNRGKMPPKVKRGGLMADRRTRRNRTRHAQKSRAVREWN